jgi:hypothetical protein
MDVAGAYTMQLTCRTGLGQNVMVHMDVSDLAQPVDGCQALLGYSSMHFLTPGTVASGGGPWTELIYETWRASGEMDMAIGVSLGLPGGTQADGTVAVITLAATGEGTTKLVFRPDGSGGYATLLSAVSPPGEVHPSKADSADIVIDGTPPSIAITSVAQGGQPITETGCAKLGVIDISVAASDSLAGLDGVPAVTVTPNGGPPESAAFAGQDPPGVFNYQWYVTAATPSGLARVDATASDKASNLATALPEAFCVTNYQVSGTVTFNTKSNNSYSSSRDVVFAATDAGGATLKTWTVTLAFINALQMASASYPLTDVPAGTANLSARTAWHLRRNLPVPFDPTGHATISFTLLGGDMDGSGLVNILDYSILKGHWMTHDSIADINGDGIVNILDYSILKENWFKRGD